MKRLAFSKVLLSTLYFLWAIKQEVRVADSRLHYSILDVFIVLTIHSGNVRDVEIRDHYTESISPQAKGIFVGPYL